ncbi:MAG: hypothetical protein U9R07_11950 [Pseudomonadota bacterium]|nr:hypothetical protein [Pseudomonadota bacterium]
MGQYIPQTKRHVLKPEQQARFLADITAIGGGELPTQVVGWSRKGKWTRIKATYPNGWELSVNFDRNEKVSSYSSKLTLRASLRLSDQAGRSTIADSDGDDGA